MLLIERFGFFLWHFCKRIAGLVFVAPDMVPLNYNLFLYNAWVYSFTLEMFIGDLLNTRHSDRYYRKLTKVPALMELLFLWGRQTHIK